MKNILLLIITIIIIISCKNEHSKEYITFKGKLEHNTDSMLTIAGKNFKKVIKINTDGTFKDTLKVNQSDIYLINTNTGKRGFIHLANGYNLTLQGDSESFMESFVFSGFGAQSNNFGIAQLKYRNTIGNPMEYFALEKEAFDIKVASVKKGLDSILNIYKNADSTLISKAKAQHIKMFDFLENNYIKQHPITKERVVLMKKTAKGKPSPKFVSYTNFKGGKSSLDDFKGKYVYIDLWATWCGPCIREIPSLQKIEKEYHQKNIAFVSISLDSDKRSGGTWEKAFNKWKSFVTQKQLSGIQLWAGKDTKFMQDYQVSGIPRFILLDPQGTIVDNNAPRPSDPQLKELFARLGI